jgi:hypothetical protein
MTLAAILRSGWRMKIVAATVAVRKRPANRQLPRLPCRSTSPN